MPSQQAFINSDYCVQQPTVLILKENFFNSTGDSASIVDHTGAPWFKVNPKDSNSKEKRVLDAYGAAAFSLKCKQLTLHHTWEVYRGESFEKPHKACDVKFAKRHSLPGGLAKLSGPLIKVYLNDGDKQPDFVAEGNFQSKKFSIFKIGASGEKGDEVAKIEKDSRFTPLQTFLQQSQEYDASTYFLQLQPGVDAAFLTALSIVIDETVSDE